MNIYTIYQQYPTNEDCLRYLEAIRWQGKPQCAYCESDEVMIRNKADGKRRRWWCKDCRRSFSVTINTIMHGTRLPLQKWMLAISILINAKKSVSSHQLGRDLDIPVKTAYSLSQRIRKAMLGNQMPLLSGIVEMDETYIGGKPRYKGESKRGRGTNKMPVIGAVERGGKVYAEPLQAKMNRHALRGFVLKTMDAKGTHLISDEFSGYSNMGAFVKSHATINHSYEYVRGDIHTNSIEGFWASVKRQHYGQHHHYSREKAPLYIGEACFKYNHRDKIGRKHGDEVFATLAGELLSCTSL